MGRWDHLAPFHTSPRVKLFTKREYWPTAVHDFAEVHHTPLSAAEPATDDAAGFGAG